MSERDYSINRRQLQEVFKDPRVMLAFEELQRQILEVIPASQLMPNFITAFDGVGDGTTNNDTAFTAAEADGGPWIFLPAGEYLTTLARETFTKHYMGPGKIITTGYALPGRFTYIAEEPFLWPVQGTAGFFRGDTSHVDPEWHVIGPGARRSLTARYFEAPFIPKPIWSEVFSGASGLLTWSAGALTVGDGSAVLTSVDGLEEGGVYGLASGMDETITDTVTIDTIVGLTITFHPTLTANYSPAAIMAGKRTHNGVRYTRVIAQAPTLAGDGGGDVYGDIVRGVQRFQPYDGQTHIFETCTLGQFGGDIFFETGSSGTMGTGWESQYQDQGEDVGVFGQVDSFVRDNDTGARSAVWIALYQVSTGSKPSDACLSIGGKWRVGVDTVRADLTTFLTAGDNINAAINTAIGHRWVMNSTASNSGRAGSALWGTFYGNTPGDMYIESGSDGVSDFMALRFNRAAPNDARLRVRPTMIQINKTLTVGGDMLAAGNVLAAGGLVVMNGSGSGDYMLANAGAGQWEFYIGGALVGTVP